MPRAEPDSTRSSVKASYVRFLEHADPQHADPEHAAAILADGGRPHRRRIQPVSGSSLPRRRAAREPLHVRLAPEQLYWLRLAAARAGRKVDESTIVAAGLLLLERLAIDWRTIGSRAALEEALALELASAETARDPGSRPEDPSRLPRRWP